MQTSGSPDGVVDQIAEQRRCNREFQHFLETAVHDLNAPLRGIATSASLLSEICGAAANPDALSLFERLQDGVVKMKALLKALAEYAAALEIEHSSFVSVPANSIVRAAWAALAPAVQNTGATIQCAPLPRVTGNWEQLSTLLRHLLANAIQYSASAPPRVAVSAERDREEWRFAIQDNGSGVDSRYHDLIFEPFQRLQGSDEPGAGLGLSICKKIVELHGGRIWIQSQSGEGSTIFFTLQPAALSP